MLDKIFKTVAGLIFIVISLLLMTKAGWYNAVMTLIKGSLVLIILLVGLGLTFWGLSELKSEA